MAAECHTNSYLKPHDLQIYCSFGLGVPWYLYFLITMTQEVLVWSQVFYYDCWVLPSNYKLRLLLFHCRLTSLDHLIGFRAEITSVPMNQHNCLQRRVYGHLSVVLFYVRWYQYCVIRRFPVLIDVRTHDYYLDIIYNNVLKKPLVTIWSTQDL